LVDRARHRGPQELVHPVAVRTLVQPQDAPNDVARVANISPPYQIEYWSVRITSMAYGVVFSKRGGRVQ
jgi:hypothetical protein